MQMKFGKNQENENKKRDRNTSYKTNLKNKTVKQNNKRKSSKNYYKILHLSLVDSCKLSLKFHHN